MASFYNQSARIRIATSDKRHYKKNIMQIQGIPSDSLWSARQRHTGAADR
jgi:hypothetical protein